MHPRRRLLVAIIQLQIKSESMIILSKILLECRTSSHLLLHVHLVILRSCRVEDRHGQEKIFSGMRHALDNEPTVLGAHSLRRDAS